MKGQKYLYTLEQTQTFINVETSLDQPKSKSYKEIWKRAMKKIKAQLMIKRFHLITNTQPYLQPEEHYPKQSRFTNKVITTTFVLFPQSPFYLFWQFVVYIGLLYLTTYGIYYSSFIGDDWKSTEILIESIIDVIFLVDILFTANLAVFDDNYRLVFKRKKIIEIYIKSDLLFDLCSCLPTGLYIKLNPDHFKYRILIFRHVIKFAKWITMKDKISNFSFIGKIDYFVIKFPNFVSTLKMILSFAIIVHIFACLFHLTARYNDFDISTWVYDTDVGYSLGRKPLFMYITSIHWAMTSISGIGYGDIIPYTDLERGLAMIWMSFGTIFVSLSASQFTNIMNNLIKSDLKVDENLSLVKEFAVTTGLEGSARHNLKKFVRDQRVITHKFLISSVIKSLDLDLRYEIALNIYDKAVTKISFLNEKDEKFVSDIIFRLEFVKYEHKEEIWCKKSHSNGIYFIISGRVHFLHDEIFFYSYTPGSFFGDLEVIMKTERKFDAVAQGICKCFKLDNEVFDYFKENYPIYYKELKAMQEVREINLLKSLTEMVLIMRFKSNLALINPQFIKDTRNELQKKLELNKIFAAKNVTMQNFVSGLASFSTSKSRIKSMIKTLNPSLLNETAPDLAIDPELLLLSLKSV